MSEALVAIAVVAFYAALAVAGLIVSEALTAAAEWLIERRQPERRARRP